MSANVNGFAVIGASIPRSILYRKYKAKCFEHSYGEDINYCPHTGRQCWVIREEPVEGYDDYVDTFKGFKVYDDELGHFLGVGLSPEVGSTESMDLPSVEKLQRLRETLDALGVNSPIKLHVSVFFR